MARRRLEVQAAIALHQAAGGRVLFGTLTIRHHAGQPLRTLWDAVSASWSAFTHGRPYVALKRATGLVGYLRVVEVTYGRNGWHVHVHFLWFMPPQLVDVRALSSWVWDRWSTAVQARGFTAVQAAQDLREMTGPADLDLSAYLAKATDLGWELTSSQTKDKGATRPVWDLLTSVIEDGTADDLDRWHDWERVSKGRRQMTWSQGLRTLLGLAKEATDEDIAAEVAGDEDLVLIEPDGWASLVARPHLIPRVLTAAERDGLPGLVSFLDFHGVTYSRREV